MQNFVDFIEKWVELIISFFISYPLAAALITIIAVIAYITVWKKLKIEDWTKHALLFFCVMVIWATLIAILGNLFKAIGAIGGMLSFFYKTYKWHPIFFIIVTVLLGMISVVWYMLPAYWKPNKILRVIICITIWLLLILLVTPILDAWGATLSLA